MPYVEVDRSPDSDHLAMMVLSGAVLLAESGIVNESRYRTKTIPSAGALLKEEDSSEKQQSFDV